jgi:acid phosphatase (class A)
MMLTKQFHRKSGQAAILLAVLLTTGCATRHPFSSAASIVRTYAAPTTGSGYDWTVLLAKPPVPNGAADSVDMAVVRGYQGLAGSPRWQQARSDASLDMMHVYGPLIRPDFTAARRPDVVALLAYAGKKFSEASNEAKTAFPRQRPFQADPSIAICVDSPPGGSSYPSGHSGWGWLSAQIVARVEPNYAETILARGRDYGLSRVICGVHYLSDIEAGRVVADAVLTRLDNDPEYQTLLAVTKSGGE